MIGSLVAVVVLAVIASLMILRGGDSVDHPLSISILSVLVLIALASMTKLVSARGERSFALLAVLYTVSFFGVPGILQSLTGVFPFFALSYPEDVAVQAAIMAIAFFIAGTAGYILTPRRFARTAATPHYSIRRVAVLPVVLVLIGIAAVGVALLGPAHFLARRDEAEMLAVTSPSVVLIRGVAQSAGFLAFSVSLFTFMKTKAKRYLWLIALTLPVTLLVNNPINSARFGIAAQVLAVVFVAFDARRKGFKLTMATAVIAGQLTIFPLLSWLGRGARASSALMAPITYVSTSGDFDGFQSLMNVCEMVRNAGLTLGARLLSAIFAFVPREMWPSKQSATGADAASAVGYSFTNISMPLPGEFFADFGWPGVVLGGFFTGWAFARLEAAAETARQQGGTFRLLALGIAVGSTVILVRGSLLGVGAPIALSVGMAFVVAAFLEKRRREPAAAPAQDGSLRLAIDAPIRPRPPGPRQS
jgi:oligosaccharide repeat unit polymerase